MKILKCDLCGKEFDNFDEQEGFGLHYSNVGYGSKFDGETIHIDMCCGCFDKMMDEYIIPRMEKVENKQENEIDTHLLAEHWNYDMQECPLDTKVYFLSGDGFPICPQQVFVGTIIYNGSDRSRGSCYQGDPEYFYRSAIIAWQPYNENLY